MSELAKITLRGAFFCIPIFVATDLIAAHSRHMSALRLAIAIAVVLVATCYVALRMYFQIRALRR